MVSYLCHVFLIAFCVRCGSRYSLFFLIGLQNICCGVDKFQKFFRYLVEFDYFCFQGNEIIVVFMQFCEIGFYFWKTGIIREDALIVDFVVTKLTLLH